MRLHRRHDSDGPVTSDCTDPRCVTLRALMEMQAEELKAVREVLRNERLYRGSSPVETVVRIGNGSGGNRRGDRRYQPEER